MTGDLALIMFPVLIGMIFLGFPVAFSMMLTALGFGLVRFGDILVLQFAQKVDEIATNYVLGAIPLFVFMGAVLERAGIAETLFDAIYMWTRKLPGGLAVAALIMCTIFAAASGVVGATETLVGMLAIPGMLKRKYDNALIAGTICGGGSLGTIIPPSIPVIVLAPIAMLPVGDLLAGIMLPGLLMAGMFILYILIACTLNPKLAPAEEEPDPRSLPEKLRYTAFALLPPGFLIFTVLGTLFAGLASRRSIRYFLEKTFGGKDVEPGLVDYAYRSAHQPGARHAPWSFLSGYLFSADAAGLYRRLSQPVWLAYGKRSDFSDAAARDIVQQHTASTVVSFDAGALPHFQQLEAFVAGYDRFLASLETSG